MRLFKNYKISKLRDLAFDIKRQGVAEEALKAIDDCDGSYKGVMELAGKMVVIADMATFDDYWLEQVNRGASKMTDRCCEMMREIKKKRQLEMLSHRGLNK